MEHLLRNAKLSRIPLSHRNGLKKLNAFCRRLFGRLRGGNGEKQQ